MARVKSKGPFKIAMKLKFRGEHVEVKTIIQHPMETGLRKDKKTGEKIPAHFIEEAALSVNGKAVSTVVMSGAVSKGPYIFWKLKSLNPGDKLTISAHDNQGAKDSVTVEVTDKKKYKQVD